MAQSTQARATEPSLPVTKAPRGLECGQVGGACAETLGGGGGPSGPLPTFPPGETMATEYWAWKGPETEQEIQKKPSGEDLGKSRRELIL